MSGLPQCTWSTVWWFIAILCNTSVKCLSLAIDLCMMASYRRFVETCTDLSTEYYDYSISLLEEKFLKKWFLIYNCGNTYLIMVNYTLFWSPALALQNSTSLTSVGLIVAKIFDFKWNKNFTTERPYGLSTFEDVPLSSETKKWLVRHCNITSLYRKPKLYENLEKIVMSWPIFLNTLFNSFDLGWDLTLKF